MRVLGIDFTSAPRRGKPITCLDCLLADGILQAGPLAEMTRFEQFEQTLRVPAPGSPALIFRSGSLGNSSRIWAGRELGPVTLLVCRG